MSETQNEPVGNLYMEGNWLDCKTADVGVGLFLSKGTVELLLWSFAI